MKFDYSPVAYTGQFWIQENRILYTLCSLLISNSANHDAGVEGGSANVEVELMIDSWLPQ